MSRLHSAPSLRTFGAYFRPEIEGLRGLAVLLVVGCHYGISWCAGGFIGVDVFFVISGYLITGQLAREYRETSRIDLLGFFARRVRRLLPASALVIAATACVAATIFAPQELDSIARSAAAAALSVSNLFFEHAASDYFAPTVERNPLLHTWSLGLEEQFYLLWPGVILLAYRGRTPRALWILVALTASSFACSLYVTRSAPLFAFYALPARAWEFAAGGLLALAPAADASVRIARWAAPGGIFGATLIVGTALLVKGGADFPGWIALCPVVGTLAVLFAGAAAPNRGIHAALAAAPLRFLGTRSYSWYLWHWPFIVFATTLLPDITPAQKVEAAIASLLVAACTYHSIERPIRENIYLKRRPRFSLLTAAGAASINLVVACGLAWFGREQLTLDDRFRVIAAAATDYGFASRECYDDGQSFEVKVCQFGDPRRPQSVVLFGDSHAMQWILAMRKVADAKGWRLITLVRPGCAASDINPHRYAEAADGCRGWRANAIKKIEAIAPALVVMTSYNGATLRGDPINSPLMSADEIRSGTRRTLLKFSASNISVVVLRDSPLPPFNIPACIARAVGRSSHTGDPCEFDAAGALNPEASLAERAAEDGLGNVYYLDMDDLICPGKTCPASQSGHIIYRDENHLAGSYAESLAPEVEERLTQILKERGATFSRNGG